MAKAISILIVENVTPVERGGNTERWTEEAQQEYGLAATEEFDLIVGLSEDGECPVILNRTEDDYSVETVMR